MIWQDIILTLVNFIFTYSLIPQVYHGFKVKKTSILFQTALLTFIGLYLSSIAMLTLRLYVSGAVMFVNATLWLLLFIQTVIYKKI